MSENNEEVPQKEDVDKKDEVTTSQDKSDPNLLSR